MNLARPITRLFDRAGVRGAPTLLRYLSRTPLAKQVATVALPSGQTISFPAYDPYWARHLYAGVPYEPDVEAIFREFAPGRTLIDCGANIGYWSARAKELGFKESIAIEANATLIPFLQRNHSGPVHHAAVHSVSGETLWLEGEGAAASLGAGGKPVRSLALRDLDVTGPVLIKLDVEGAEIQAIEGAHGMDAMFLYEDWPKSGLTVTDYLLKNGYSVLGFDQTPIRSLGEAFAFNRTTNARYGPSNFIAIRSAG
jgi:FkbM family methyltransferase